MTGAAKKSAVRPAFITGGKLPPCPLLGVILFPFVQVHVVAQQDERVGAGTRAEDMTMVVDVTGWGQCRDVTAAHGAVIGQPEFGLAAVMANCVPPLVGLDAADRSDRNPAMVGVGVSHHSFWPVEQHQPGTAVGLDQPRPSCRLSGHRLDQRTEILLVGGECHQEPSYLVHIEDVARPQLIQLSQEMAKRARDNASAHLFPAPDPAGPESGPGVVRWVDAAAMTAVPSSGRRANYCVSAWGPCRAS